MKDTAFLILLFGMAAIGCYAGYQFSEIKASTRTENGIATYLEQETCNVKEKANCEFKPVSVWIREE